MPKSLIAWIVIIFVFLMFSAYLAMRDRTKYRHRYHKFDNHMQHHHSMFEQTNSSPVNYQNSSDYALPPKQKVVTYCVVDGRLIDK